jgi:hypothetical protein
MVDLGAITRVAEPEKLSDDQAYCYLCGQLFKTATRYLMHRFDRQGFVYRGGCIPSSQVQNHNSAQRRKAR